MPHRQPAAPALQATVLSFTPSMQTWCQPGTKQLCSITLNHQLLTGSPLRSLAKLAYYNAFAWVYGFCGGCAHCVMVNSSWTRRHVASLFWRPPSLLSRLLTPRLSVSSSSSSGVGKKGNGGVVGPGPHLVYPPCDTEELQTLPLDRWVGQGQDQGLGTDCVPVPVAWAAMGSPRSCEPPPFPPHMPPPSSTPPPTHPTGA